MGDPEQIESLFAAETAPGPVAYLVNNAGISGKSARVDAQDADLLNRLFAVNVIGTMLCTAAAVLALDAARRQGRRDRQYQLVCAPSLGSKRIAKALRRSH